MKEPAKKLQQNASLESSRADSRRQAQQALPLIQALESEHRSLTVKNPRIIRQKAAQPAQNVEAPVPRPVNAASAKVVDFRTEVLRRTTDDELIDRLTQMTSSDSEVQQKFSRTFVDVARLLFVPVLAVLLLGGVIALGSARSFEPKGVSAFLASNSAEEFTNDLPLPPDSPIAINSDSLGGPLSNEEVAKSGFFATISARIASIASAPKEPSTPVTDIEDLKSKVKFISGLIAMHRPSIANCGEVAKAIVEVAVKERIDPFFIAAVISIESKFANSAVSSVGARGLMQLMPATARSLGRLAAGNGIHSQLEDTRTNIDLGVKYLRALEARYRGDKALALAAYNWGPGNLDRARREGRRVPGSVQSYASTILQRSRNWANHFQKAKESALSLDATDFSTL